MVGQRSGAMGSAEVVLATLSSTIVPTLDITRLATLVTTHKKILKVLSNV